MPPLFGFEKSRFFDFHRYHRQARKQDEGTERSPLPVFHNRDRNEGEVRISQPIELMGKNQAPEIVEHPKVEIEHEPAHQPNDGEGSGQRNDERDTAYLLHELIAGSMKEQRNRHPEHQLNRQVYQQEEQSSNECFSE